MHGLQSGYQFFPWIGTDPQAGTLHVAFYDTRNDPVNNRTIQWFATSSQNGSLWAPQLLIAQAPSDAGAFGGNNDMLEYNGIGGSGGRVYTCWSDNSNFTGDNPSGTLTPDGFDVVTSVFMLDPDG